MPNNSQWHHFLVSLSISTVNNFPLFLLPAMNEKASLPTSCRCLTCAWRSLNKGSPAPSTCTWAPPCSSGNTHDSISPPAQLRSTQNLKTEEETSDLQTDVWPPDRRLTSLWCEEHHGGGHEDAPHCSCHWIGLCSPEVFCGQQSSVLLSCLNESREYQLWLLHLNIPLGML